MIFSPRVLHNIKLNKISLRCNLFSIQKNYFWQFTFSGKSRLFRNLYKLEVKKSLTHFETTSFLSGLFVYIYTIYLIFCFLFCSCNRFNKSLDAFYNFKLFSLHCFRQSLKRLRCGYDGHGVVTFECVDKILNWVKPFKWKLQGSTFPWCYFVFLL